MNGLRRIAADPVRGVLPGALCGIGPSHNQESELCGRHLSGTGFVLGRKGHASEDEHPIKKTGRFDPYTVLRLLLLRLHSGKHG
jgi:hypothetical protein